MKHYKFVGYAKQKGKNEWDKFIDAAVFACPDNQDPYTFFDPQLREMFDYWLIEYKEMDENIFNRS